VSGSKSGSDLAVVVGGYVNGLGLVRTLSELGYQVVVITTRTFDIAHYSCLVKEYRAIADLANEPGHLAELLIANSHRWGGALVFPSNDEAITALDTFREDLDSFYTLVIPDPESVPFILDKRQMLNAAGKTGITLPRSYGAADERVLANPGIEFPVVIKPVTAGEFSSRFKEKLFVADNMKSLAGYISLLSKSGLQGEIFDLVPGPDCAIYACAVYMDRKGDPVAECTIRKLRQTPPFFGIARVAELFDRIPLLSDQTIELLRKINFRGLGVAEFKWDMRTETFQFFEVNGRSVVYNALLGKGGLNFPALARDDYAKKVNTVAETSSHSWVWINLHADLLRTVQNWGKEDLRVRDYMSPYFRPKTYAVWSARDPKPFYRQWKKTVLKGSRNFTNGFGRFPDSKINHEK